MLGLEDSEQTLDTIAAISDLHHSLLKAARK
jgi:hypothetical protein